MLYYFAVVYLESEYFNQISFVFGSSEGEEFLLVNGKICTLNETLLVLFANFIFKIYGLRLFIRFA